MQRDAADRIGIHRSTDTHDEESGRDYYPIEHMEKLAQLDGVEVEELLDGYNLFLHRG